MHTSLSWVDHAPIDEDSLAGHVVTVGAGKERDELRHVSRGLEATKCDAAHELLGSRADLGPSELCEALVDLLPHVRAHDARAIGIHSDTVRSVLLGSRLGQGTDSKFRGTVGPEQRGTLVACLRGSRNDLSSMPASLELGCSKLDAPQNTLHVDGVDTVHVLLGDLEDGRHLGDPCVVHDNVEAAKLGLGSINGSRHLIAARDICHHCRHLRTTPREKGSCLIQLGFVAVHQHHSSTVLRQAVSDRQTDAHRSASHQGHLASDALILRGRSGVGFLDAAHSQRCTQDCKARS
mmetsp:Transcript_37841/g.56496  ORF Transcript_37841/g.56496 Transcript_37841/m.56496 type:complete len:293 (-) Transcript_37841:25-903(-)